MAKELGLTAVDAADGLREHTVGITFELKGLLCRSRRRLLLDAEGTFLFDLEAFAENGDMFAAPTSQHTGIPVVAVRVLIRRDGGRQLQLRGHVTLRNETAYAMDFAFMSMPSMGRGTGRVAGTNDHDFDPGHDRGVDVNGDDDGGNIDDDGEAYIRLYPGEEVPLPLRYTHTGTPVYARITRNGYWEEVLPNLGAVALRGKFGTASRLAAAVFDARHDVCGHDNRRWVGLIKPSATTCGRGEGKDSGHVRVVWPSVASAAALRHDADTSIRDSDWTLRQTDKRNSLTLSLAGPLPDSGGGAGSDSTGGFLDDFIGRAVRGGGRSGSVSPYILTLSVLPPLKLRSQICQPFLYRLATWGVAGAMGSSQPIVLAEGTLGVGEEIGIHDISQVTRTRTRTRTLTLTLTLILTLTLTLILTLTRTLILILILILTPTGRTTQCRDFTKA